jgi:hypothetical protein
MMKKELMSVKRAMKRKESATCREAVKMQAAKVKAADAKANEAELYRQLQANYEALASQAIL